MLGTIEMAESLKLHQKTHELVDDIKSSLHQVHGAGDAIRGGAMEALDAVFHKREGEERNRAIAEQGMAEMNVEEHETALRSHHHHGESPHANPYGERQGEGNHLANALLDPNLQVPARSTSPTKQVDGAVVDPAGINYVGVAEGDSLRAAREASAGVAGRAGPH